MAPCPIAPKVCTLEGVGLPGVTYFSQTDGRVDRPQIVGEVGADTGCLVGLNSPGDETSSGPRKSARTSQDILIIKTVLARHVPNR